MIKKLITICLVLCLIIISASVISAETVLTEAEFRKEITDEFPPVLNIGTYIECGDYSIKIMAQPVVASATSSLTGFDDLSILVVRIAIKNNSDHLINWLTSHSFSVTEYCMGEIYGSYPLSSIFSAKSAAGYGLSPFFSPIQPGQELLTVAAFEVYGKADGWMMTFSPVMRQESFPEDSVIFSLPKAVYQ